MFSLGLRIRSNGPSWIMVRADTDLLRALQSGPLLRGSRLSRIDQQRLATVLGPAYWQKLQCIFRMTVQVNAISTTSMGPLAVTNNWEKRQQLVEVAVAGPCKPPLG
jgi:hypothetical protein